MRAKIKLHYPKYSFQKMCSSTFIQTQAIKMKNMHQTWQNSKPLIIFKTWSKIIFFIRTKNLSTFKVKRKFLR